MLKMLFWVGLVPILGTVAFWTSLAWWAGVGFFVAYTFSALLYVRAVFLTQLF